ncbi:UDP-glucose 4-epimerase GalE [Halorhodospira halophila]|uniref:UDP-glucose 4-epimerase n=1 Tax=Halorhodospira halophila (strain DSM 244 / SL1) TaxID=349124 RepID=A1WV35_HALHL|nr:UDP-glucose 4-epimerase GalE [Halorhodospira halophila]ABM61547.1 UDP-galactose 4-epimerase [Halorhodospira halophila SL1]MBK1728793.1 UDP-glucose 4-epimerase GalE [Halorhodospira halophila]
MTILVTGGAGYIGSHMVRRLLADGYEVVALDNLSTGHRWAVPEECLEVGDLQDRDALSTLFQRYRFSAVVHFAASSLVGESEERPLEYHENNVGGTLNLLRACLELGTTRLIFSSSAAVYGAPSESPIPESVAPAPINPYGVSKMVCERMLADVSVGTSLRFVSLRYFNAAGADPKGRLGECHEPETHLIPRLLQVVSGRSAGFTLYGDDYPTPDGTCIRDYIHVEDLVEAHVIALAHLEAGGESRTFNCGYGRGYSVREVIEVARAVTGHPLPVDVGPRRPGDPSQLVADGSALRETLGWRPRYESLETIVRDAWRWESRLQGMTQSR